MKILYFKHEDKLIPGIATEKGVIDINKYLTDPKKKYTDQPITNEDLAVLKKIEQQALEQNTLNGELRQNSNTSDMKLFLFYPGI